MTKQSRHPRRRRPNNLWIAMLATLAFTGAGQALAPAPAAALHIDACAQPESGLCDAADEGPTSGDSSSGTSKGGGGFGSSASAPDPGLAAWNQREPNGVPTWMIDARVRDKAFRHHCKVIGNRVAEVEDEYTAITDWLVDKIIPTAAERHENLRDPQSRFNRAIVDMRKLKRQLKYLGAQWDSFDCTELGL